jgi:hypothetical protein
LKLTQENFSLNRRQVNWPAAHQPARSAFEAGNVLVVISARNIVHHASRLGRIIGAMLPDPADKPARIAGQPIAVTGVRQEPMTIHARIPACDCIVEDLALSKRRTTFRFGRGKRPP